MENIISELKRRRREIFTYIRPWLKNQNIPINKFVIFAQARTGSILLGSLLNSHPKIFCDGEIFSVWNKNLFFPFQYIQCHATRRENRVYGWQLKIDQLILLQRTDPQQFMFHLQKSGWKIIYLRRANLLRQAISELIARSRDEWADTTKTPLRNLRIHIDCNRLLDLIKYREKMLRQEENALKNLLYLPVVYEADLLQSQRQQETLNCIFNYIGLSSISVKTKYFRTTSDRLSDFVQNYDEMVSAVKQTDYYRFIE